MSYSIFISYSTTDGFLYAQQIKDKFEEEGIMVWIDKLIEKGASYPSAIEQAIRDCRVVILVVTPIACLSSYVDKEFQFAKAEQKRIVPFFCMPTESVDVPIEWGLLQWVDFINNPEETGEFIKKTSDWLDGKISPEFLDEGQINATKRFLDKGKMFYKQEAYGKALEAFRQATKPTGSLAAVAWYNLGKTLHHLREYRAAIEAYEHSLVYNEDSGVTWYNKGVALTRLELFPEALEAFSKATEKNSEDEDAWYNKGIILEYLGRYDEAIKACERAFGINPTMPNYVQETILRLKETINKQKHIKRRWLHWLKKRGNIS